MCTTITDNSDVQSALASVASTFDALLRYMHGAHGLPPVLLPRKPNPCLPVILSMQTCIGILIPGLLIYTFEADGRRKWLAQQLKSSSRSSGGGGGRRRRSSIYYNCNSEGGSADAEGGKGSGDGSSNRSSSGDHMLSSTGLDSDSRGSPVDTGYTVGGSWGWGVSGQQQQPQEIPGYALLYLLLVAASLVYSGLSTLWGVWDER